MSTSSCRPGCSGCARLAVRRQPKDDAQTIAGARRNISRHYDLSNDLFALFLDETMTYSSASVRHRRRRYPGRGPGTCSPRRSAARSTGCSTGPGSGPAAGCSRSAPAGASWPSRPRAGARACVTITISREQQALAARRVAEAGLAAQVSVELRDYRDVDGEFDAICSVEMLEAVGERYWDAYFAALDAHLAPGGRIGLQTITMPHDRMLATRHTYTWIHKYIFPGGLLPSVTAIENSLTGATRLRITGREDFGAHYAETLRIWRERFGARADEVAGLGFDEVFNRMWNFYLCYSEAGFRAGVHRRQPAHPGPDMTSRKPDMTAAKPAGKQQSTPAAIIAALLKAHAGLDLRLRAWDGSEAGPRKPRSW